MDHRDSNIDFLRTLGLLLLIVAHTCPPRLVFILRSFDVPLMVFISGVCWHLPSTSHKNVKNNYAEGNVNACVCGGGGYSTIYQIFTYYKKRTARIYKPTFVFLTIYFAIEIILHLFINTDITSTNDIIGSFFLLNSPSIGYVWIMRVFILMALLSPLYNQIALKSSVNQFIIIICLSLIVQQFIIYKLNIWSNNLAGSILNQIIPYAFGYGIITLIGLKIKHLNRENIAHLLIGTILIAITVVIVSLKFHISLPTNKYPPNVLFLCYGIIMCVSLWMVKSVFNHISKYRWIQYISRNSMWIYLWHIIGVNIISYNPTIFSYWPLRYLFVLTIALSFTFLYNLLMSKLKFFTK